MKVEKTVTSIIDVNPSEWHQFGLYKPCELGEYDLITFASKRGNKTIRGRWDGKAFIGRDGRLDRVYSFAKVRTADEARLLPSFS